MSHWHEGLKGGPVGGRFDHYHEGPYGAPSGPPLFGDEGHQHMTFIGPSGLDKVWIDGRQEIQVTMDRAEVHHEALERLLHEQETTKDNERQRNKMYKQAGARLKKQMPYLFGGEGPIDIVKAKSFADHVTKMQDEITARIRENLTEVLTGMWNEEGQALANEVLREFLIQRYQGEVNVGPFMIDTEEV
jgi:hypothetical protein